MAGGGVRLLSLLLLAGGCGGDSGGPTPGQDLLRARVDGVLWGADLTLDASWSGGTLSVSGTGGAPGSFYSLTLTVTGVQAAGTFALGPATAGSSIEISRIAQPIGTWVTAAAGGTGTVTVAELTTSRARGTFSFTGGPVAGSGATGTKVVTEGVFEVRF